MVLSGGYTGEIDQEACEIPLSSEHGTYKAVQARFWLCLSGKIPKGVVLSSLGSGL